MADCLVERDGPVMVVTFNRPERMNAMGGTLLAEFLGALEEGRRDDRVKAFVVTGAGRAWCAGADLQAMGSGGGDGHSRRFAAVDDIGEVGRVVLAMHHCDKPLIAAVNGVAVGGGFGLCSAFDIRVASEEARFATIFIKRALAPDCGLSYFLPRLVGPEKAAELFYSGRMVDAREALALGLVSKVVPAEELLPTAVGMAREFAALPPAAMTYTRRALRRSLDGVGLADQLAFEWAQQKACLGSAEFQEGVQAFLEKREPDYSKF